MEKIWLKKYVKGVPASIRFEDITLSQALARTAARYPRTNALMFQGTDMTFRELEESASRFASALKSAGVNIPIC
ncbi:MAG: hypothetical protein FJY85_08930 [Deltaproteobacteria bacterium]|nr:hypothetical protein [Deltaproteobacteria bacterium]